MVIEIFDIYYLLKFNSRIKNEIKKNLKNKQVCDIK